jgi:uncharacterized protein YidB (DUF937 family)
VLAKTDLGSIGGLLNQLQQGGLAGQVGSWLGNGTNLPISVDQLRRALGERQLQQVADASGTPIDELLKMLTQHLPATVDSMSPDGTLQERAQGEGDEQQDAEQDDAKADDQSDTDDAPARSDDAGDGRSLADQAGLGDIKL